MLALIGALLAVLVGHGVLTAVVARIAGVPPKAVGLFAGPKLWEGEIGGLRIKLGALPLMSYVEFDQTGPEDQPTTTLDMAPRFSRLAIALVPWAILLTPAFVILGPTGAIEALADGFVGFPLGGLLFWSEGVERVDAIRQLLETTNGATIAGLGIATLTAANLLPFPGNSGTRAITALLPAGVERILPPVWALMILSTLGWVIALVMWAVSG